MTLSCVVVHKLKLDDLLLCPDTSIFEMKVAMLSSSQRSVEETQVVLQHRLKRGHF